MRSTYRGICGSGVERVRVFFDRFRLSDLATKVAGVGSIGTWRTLWTQRIGPTVFGGHQSGVMAKAI
jgi:hypothetical protein